MAPSRAWMFVMALACIGPLWGCGGEDESPEADREADESHLTTVTAGSSATRHIVSTPLSTPSGSGTSFRKLSPEETGIDFVNRLNPQNNVALLYIGADVAAGDMTGMV